MDRQEPSELIKPSDTGRAAGEERLIASVVVLPSQLDLFGIMSPLGADRRWVRSAFGVLTAPVETVAAEVRKLSVEAGFAAVAIKEVVWPAYSALRIVASRQPAQPGELPPALTERQLAVLRKMTEAAVQRLKHALSLITQLEPLDCSEENFARDKLLRDVAQVKARGIPRLFAWDVVDNVTDDVGGLKPSVVAPRRPSPFLQGPQEESTFSGSIRSSRSGAEWVIRPADGKKSLSAGADHGDVACFRAHAAAMGGTAQITVQQDWSYFEAAPQLKRAANTLKHIAPDDNMLAQLTGLQ